MIGRNIILLTDSEEEVNRLLAESDSDSAPEDVDFVSSKANALQRAKNVRQQLEEEKTKQKDKRKKLDSLYKQQKVCVRGLGLEIMNDSRRSWKQE